MPFMEDQQESPAFGGSLADDLFNDPQSALPGPEHFSGSYTAAACKFGELAINGASQKIAWSNNGMIARISGDGKSVHLQTLVRRTTKAEFELSEPVELELPPSRFQLPLTHVSWSPVHATSMLALVDAAGHLALYTASAASCRLNKTALLTFDGQSSNAGCVALHWLRSRQSNPGPVKNAWKAANAWAYATSQDKLIGPTTAVTSAQAFLAITRDNLARLCFQQLNATWQNVETVLAPCDSLEHMLSHASIAPYKDNSLIVATLSLQSTLRIYDIRIEWGADFDARGQLKPGLQLGPNVIVQCLKIFDGFGVEQRMSLSETRTQPCHLLCMPTCSDGSDTTIPTSVIAVFSTSAQSHASSMSRTFSSKVVVHSVKEGTEALHSSFTSMAARRSKSLANTSRPVVTITQEAELEIPGLVVATNPQRADTMLVILTHDGACRILDRSSNQLLECDTSTTAFKHPLQAAFSFPAEDEADFFDCTFSPSGCAIAKCEKDRAVNVRQMTQVLQEPDLRTVAALSMMSATSMFLNLNNEDALMRSWQLLDTFSPQEVLSEVFKAVLANFEFVSEESQQRLTGFLLNPIFTKALSILEVLEVPSNGRRSIPSKLASVMLELRWLGMGLQLLMNDRSEPSPQLDISGSVQGLIDWFNTLVCFLVDDVLDIKRRLSNIAEYNLSHIQSEVTRTGTPAVALLLVSSSRMLLRAGCRYIRSITAPNGRLAASVVHPLHQASYRRVEASINQAPINLKSVEETLHEINHHAQEAYNAAGVGELDRRNLEREFLVTGVVPEVLDPLARRLIDTSIDRLVEKAGVDTMELFKVDVRPLGLTDDESTKEWWKGRRRCAFRKIDIPPSVKKYRRCARCLRVTEEFTDPRTTPAWIGKLQRQCVCGSAWIAMEA